MKSHSIPKYVCKFLKHILCYYPEAYSGGLRRLIPSWISEIYDGGGFPPPPLIRKRNVSHSWGKKPEYAFLISLKPCLSSQSLLNLSKYKSEDQEIHFKDLHFSVSQIVHSLFYRLCIQALLCCLKLYIVQ